MPNYHSEYAKTIDEAPNYEITNHGRVFNITTGREMVLSPTLNGDLTVGLVRDGHQYRYSVKGLVARAFVPGETEFYNTPILLDTNQSNLYYENIVWRPRWFAWLYTRQFHVMEDWYYFGPINELGTTVQYANYIEAAQMHGLLCKDIRLSIYNHIAVFPTHQMFEYTK